MADIDDFLPDILPFCAGVPSAIAERQVLHACRQFCDQTLLIRETLAAIDIVVDDQEYDLTVSAGTETITAIYVMYDGVQIYPAGEDTLDQRSPGWRNGGGNRKYHLVLPSAINLSFKPEEAITGGLVVRVATRPTLTATTVADLLQSDWQEGIAHGALYRLKSMRGQDWFDPEGSLERRRMWNNTIIEGKSVALRTHSRENTRIKQRPVAGGSQR